MASPLQNLMPEDGSTSTSSRSLKVVNDLAAGFSNKLRSAISSVRDEVRKLNDELKTTSRLKNTIAGTSGGDLGLGLGSVSSSGGKYYQPTIPGMDYLGGRAGGGGAGGGTAGEVFKNPGWKANAGYAALAAGSFVYSAIPSVNDAVAQRIASQGAASYTGMSAVNVMKSANAYGYASGGMTGSYDMSLAAAQMLYSGGYLYGSGTSRNMMPQLGALSAMTGMSNPQVAGAMSTMNGMQAMSVGVRLRDAKGNMLAPSEIANNVYRRMYGNKNITAEQAALVYNPNSVSHQNLMMMAGGNQDTFNVLAEMMRLQAANGGKQIDLSNANAVMDKMGYAKDDPRRSMFNKNSSQAKLLEGTSSGLISGYNAANNMTAAVNNGLAGMAQILPGVVNGLAALKGTLETLPGNGNTGSSIAGGAASLVENMAAYAGGSAAMRSLTKYASKEGLGGTQVLKQALLKSGMLPQNLFKGGGAKAAEQLALDFGESAGARTAAKVGTRGLGSAIPVLGNLLGIGFGAWDGYKGNSFGQGITGSLLGGALAGGVMGFMAGGPIGALLGALGGGATGALEYGAGYLGGSLFHQDDVVPMGQASTGTGAAPAGAASTASLNGLLQQAMQYVGKVPYKYGGTTTKGWDCSGFVQSMFAKIGVSLPRTAQQQSTKGALVGNNLSNARPGDLLFFHFGSGSDYIDHVAIYIGNGKMVEAPHTGAMTRISNVPTNALKMVRRVGGGQVGAAYNQLVAGTGAMLQTSSGNTVGGASTGANSGGIAVDYTGVHGGAVPTVTSMLAGVGMPGTSFAGSNPFSANGTTADAPATPSTPQTNVAPATASGLIQLLFRTGFRGKGLSTSFGVAMAESGGRSNASNTNNDKYHSVDRGLFQINDHWHPEVDQSKIWDPAYNAAQAFRISNHGASWGQWATFNSGAYSRFSKAAQKAIAAANLPAYDKGAYKIGADQLAMVHKDEMVVPAKLADAVRSSLGGGSGSGNSQPVHVEMNVTISSATNEQEVRTMARKVADIWESGSTASTIGKY